MDAFRFQVSDITHMVEERKGHLKTSMIDVTLYRLFSEGEYKAQYQKLNRYWIKTSRAGGAQQSINR
ncbi:hypothetical protein KIN20_027276 [Parelaphostrongylus tenuis]|uniref:Uncharacterized protein n=1 Tax=Parelaphostrongylus tenuis TaxID=148309 RepID=A0AAD5QZ56_PARTN|nr:hypothetical protein KIN20_027276 [Parelaphostrongylus tenuis]